MSHGQNRPLRLPNALLLVVTLAFSVWFTITQFIPYIPSADLFSGHDGLRYHIFAQHNASASVLSVLTSSDIGAFGQSGFPVLLSLLYGLTTPHPLVACVANWLLWASAGFLLSGMVETDSRICTRAAFMNLWLLYPESIAWCGLVFKEPLVVFAVACAARSCCSGISRWAKALIVGTLALLLLTVRSTAVPLVLIALIISLGYRLHAAVRRKMPRVILLVVLGVVSLYVASGSDTVSDDSDNPLATAGYTRTESSAQGLSTQSLLRRMGSSNRYVDTLYIPIRSMANIAFPLYLNPLDPGLPVDDVQFWLEALSAVICFIAVLALALRLSDRPPWTIERAILFGIFALGFMALGLSGIIHERYRSLVIPALLPLGLMSFKEEIAAHGSRRLLIGAAILPSASLLYQLVRGF